jgi:ERCC4-type nuclease
MTPVLTFSLGSIPSLLLIISTTSVRVIQTWSYRWTIEIFHEFAKQVTGFESAQVRNEEAVKRHFRLSCVAQSLLQSLPCQGQKSERFMFAHNQQTIGQQLYSLTWLRLPKNAASGARSICPKQYL